MAAFTYTAPESLEEAIALLDENTDARALAGGLSLLLESNRSRLPSGLLVDLRKIQGLSGIQTHEREGSLWVGAMTSLASIASDETIRRRYSALAEAARATGDAQVRNRASLGGNLADNDPASDLLAAVLALGAEIHVLGPRGGRTIAADAWIAGPAQTTLAAGELITAISVPAVAERTGSAYEKFKHPATLYAVCGIAASLTLAADGTVRDSRGAVTGAAEYAVRLQGVEAALVGQPTTADALAAASEQAEAGLALRSDRFASAQYRGHLTRVLTQRALQRALERASAAA